MNFCDFLFTPTQKYYIRGINLSSVNVIFITEKIIQKLKRIVLR